MCEVLLNNPHGIIQEAGSPLSITLDDVDEEYLDNLRDTDNDDVRDDDEFITARAVWDDLKPPVGNIYFAPTSR